MYRPATFSQRLKSALDMRQITKAELSRLTGISKSSLTRYVKGDWKGKQDAVYAIAQALDVNEAWLMGYDVPMGRQDVIADATREKDPDESGKFLCNMRTYGGPLDDKIIERLYKALQSVGTKYSETDLLKLVDLAAKVLATPPDQFDTVSGVINALLK